MYKVLLVEDDAIISKTIQYYLKQCECYEVFSASTAGEALSEMRHSPDIVLLDIMLPDVNGVDLCKKIREYTYCPIIFISAIDDDETIVRALEYGGDDYLVKPFSNKVLNARIQSNLRRSTPYEKKVNLDYKGFSISTEAHAIVRNGEYISLAPIEYDILMILVKKAGTTISVEEIFQSVWNHPSYGDIRTVTVHISNIRKKLGDDTIIKTVRGKGYMFCAEEK